MSQSGVTPSRTPTADLSAVLELILVSAIEILKGTAGAVALWDERARRLSLRVASGLSREELEALHPALDSTIMRLLGQTSETISLYALRGSSGFVGGRDVARRILALPLRRVNHLTGVIYVFRPASAASFVPGDIHLLDVFARQAAAAIEHVQAQANLIAERERLQELQNTFVSIVSHELQTPVAIIKGYAGTLARDDVTWAPSIVQRVASAIESECDRLTRMITDMLDLARIQAGRVAMTMSKIDVGDLLADTLEFARARSDRHTFRVGGGPSFPTLRGDVDKLRQALHNLVENAIKYSPSGGTIEIGAAEMGDRVHLWVADQGIGVAPEDRERIFERFERVDTRLSRDTPGVGLGLFIVKVIVDAHNGKVWVESRGPGQGSRFVISLPRGGS